MMSSKHRKMMNPIAKMKVIKKKKDQLWKKAKAKERKIICERKLMIHNQKNMILKHFDYFPSSQAQCSLNGWIAMKD